MSAAAPKDLWSQQFDGSILITEILPELVAHSASLDYVTWHGHQYHNQSSKGCGSEDKDCLMKDRASIHVPASEIEYIVSCSIDRMRARVRGDIDPETFARFNRTPTNVQAMLERIDQDGLNTVIFPEKMTVKFINVSGFNSDHRGSDHTKIKLDVHREFTLRGPTLRDFVEGFFRIKSHKFDLWYELFTDIQKFQLSKSNPSDPSAQSNLTLWFSFDHGS